MLEPRLQHCQFAQWYKYFKHLTPRTRVLTAPESFRNYLTADGLYVPSDTDESDVNSSSTDDSANDEEEAEPHLPPEDFHRLILDTIADLGGAVAPKLNWSAPKDATWIMPGTTMKAKSPSEVYMLIKASDFCTHDLALNPPTVTLVLREWFDIVPSMEFRCFVRDKTLIAASQRDINYYDFLHGLRSNIWRLLADLATELVGKYPDSSFSFDAYIPRSLERAWLIDINPWLNQTDTLLFSWEELPSIEPELRLVDREDATRTFSSKPHSANNVPHDLIDMPSDQFSDLISQIQESRRSQLAEDEAGTSQTHPGQGRN